MARGVVAAPLGVIDPIRRFSEEVGLPGPVLATALLVSDVVLARILAPSLKRALRLSTALAWLYLAIVVLRCVVYAGDEVDRLLKVIGAVGLALAFAQTAFVLVIDFIIGRNGRRPLRPMLRYGLLALVFLVAALGGLRAGGVTTFGVLASGAVVVGGIGAAVAEIFRQVGAGMLVQYERPFDVDDVVYVRALDLRGRVLATGWRTTQIVTTDGIEHLVPNSDFVVNVVSNWGHGDRVFRRSIAFEAAYETPPFRVEKAVLQAIRELPGVETSPEPKVVLRDFHDSGIAYQLWYWTCRAEEVDALDAQVRSRIWYAFSREGLSFPYPTRTLHLASVPANVAERSLGEPSSTTDDDNARPPASFDRSRTDLDGVHGVGADAKSLVVTDDSAWSTPGSSIPGSLIPGLSLDALAPRGAEAALPSRRRLEAPGRVSGVGRTRRGMDAPVATEGDALLVEIARVPLFADVETAAMQRLAGCGRLQLFGPGELVFAAGDVGSALYLLLEGEVAVRGRDGQELFRLTRGEIFGEMAALSGEPRTASIATVTPVRALMLDADDFRSVVQEHPFVAERLGALLSHRRASFAMKVADGARASDELEGEGAGIVLRRLRDLLGLGGARSSRRPS